MTKEQLYTAIENANERALAVANEIRDIEANYSGDELAQKLEEIKFLRIQDVLVGEESVKDNVVTLCDMIGENG